MIKVIVNTELFIRCHRIARQHIAIVITRNTFNRYIF